MKAWIGAGISLLIALAAVAVTYGQSTEKISTLEQRAKEDRRNTREAIGEVKEHVKLIDQNTQLILQELRAMQAVQKAERSRR